MKKRPDYFESIRRSASARWDQLERDPELAAPWHQLFKQVQSPRHVLSELLQNADDAGATEAVVSIQNGIFCFAHNGEDFTADHFRSLCRFGYSNKRSLHTIGFRGIGFKSTFSVGDEVRLFTPTLSVAFRRRRFTEPVWIDCTCQFNGWTEIQVAIQDEHRQRELQKNLEEWGRSPVSLLFFRSIRRLRIEEQEIHWESAGPGPVDGSEWMVLSTNPDQRYLLVRSGEEEFPADALEEIRQERMAMEDDLAFPPCRVEIVLGMEGRLFVVLPTGVKTGLPFACSAPFVQDPARVKIKDPEISLTNRWLLHRVGELAAQALLAWVGNKALEPEQRAAAYGLWMNKDRADTSLEASCAALVSGAFMAVMKQASCLLTEQGKLEPWLDCIALPQPLLDVWTPNQLSTLFDRNRRAILSRHVAGADRQKLVQWGCISEVTLTDVCVALKSTRPPKPKHWWQLLQLWACISSEVAGSRYYISRFSGVRIIPVQGMDLLYGSDEVVRLGERQLLQSQADWTFLSNYLLVLNQNWTRYLAEQRRIAGEEQDGTPGGPVEAAYALLRVLGLDETSDLPKVLAKVSDRFFSQPQCSREDCIRLAQIAAKLGAQVPGSFQFVTQDGCRRPVTSDLMVDGEGDLDRFVDPSWYRKHVLHEDYGRTFTSCTEAEWRQWCGSPRSGLLGFVPFSRAHKTLTGERRLHEALAARGLKGEIVMPYQSRDFLIDDYDFDQNLWDHWKRQVAEDERFWALVMSRILKQPASYWSKATQARCLQVARNGHSRAVTHEPLLPGWIVKFRELLCLQDTYGRYVQPAELLRRTPETEALLDVEPFIRREFDTEGLAPLLALLGVRETATGPGPLLERLRALSGLAHPPVHEVKKWYHRLDQIIEHCSTDEFHQIETAFQTTPLILTNGGEWVRVAEVFLTADEEDVPGAAVVHPAMRDLGLWRRLHVQERPTAELAISWLKGLPSDQPLSPDELRRVRFLLPRYPDRIWTECGHWLSLEGEWVPTGSLAYALTMQSLIPWKHLFALVKGRTADFQKLPAELCEREPFSRLPRLGSCIEERFAAKPGSLPPAFSKPWLVALGDGLERMMLDDEAEMSRVRDLGRRLKRTHWQPAPDLETVPYLDGTPAGTPRRTEALWREDVLYVAQQSTAKMAAAVPQELSRAFDRADIGDALKLCYERPPEFVTEYLEANFALAEPEVEEAAARQEDRREESPAVARSQVAVTHEPPQERPPVPADWIKKEEREHDPAPPRPAKPPKPSLIDLFAFANGFDKDGPGRYSHGDGSSLVKRSDSLFPWVYLSATGEPLRSYFDKEHCLEREPLQLDSAIWQLCQQSPDLYGLILLTPEGEPLEIPGWRLKELHESGLLSLYPATYRLVYGT